MGLRQEKRLLVSGSLSHPSYLAHAHRSAQRKSRCIYDSVINSILNRTFYDKKRITQDIYELIFLVFISRKLQLSSIVRILFLCPIPN